MLVDLLTQRGNQWNCPSWSLQALARKNVAAVLVCPWQQFCIQRALPANFLQVTNSKGNSEKKVDAPKFTCLSHILFGMIWFYASMCRGSENRNNDKVPGKAVSSIAVEK